MAWLPLTSTTVEPARLDMARWASGGIILSSVVTRYQLGLVLHAGSLIAPLMAPMPHGTWESAINAAFSGSTGAAAGGSFISDPTDLPLSGAKAAMYTRAETFGWFPASVITAPP